MHKKKTDRFRATAMDIGFKVNKSKTKVMRNHQKTEKSKM